VGTLNQCSKAKQLEVLKQVVPELAQLGIKKQKCRETREQLKFCETREVRYTSGNLNPN